MAPLSQAGAALAALRDELSGEVFAPGDAGYDAARAGSRPAVIARCADPADVVRAVRFARDLDLPVAVGGAVGYGGVLVDLRRMYGVSVDPEARTVRVEGGAVMSHLDRACRPYGLAAPGAPDSAAGVAGFVLGGGTGWLDRAFGLAVDGLRGVELVTADAERIRAGPEEHPELFWALHGGGGNFGVATALTLDLRELPEFAATLLLYRPERGPEVVRAFREAIETGPDRLSGALLYLSGPLGFVPEELVGRPVCGVLVTYAGGAGTLRELAAPLPVADGLPYAEALGMFDTRPGLRSLSSAECLTGLPDDLVDLYCSLGARMPVPTGTRHLLFPQGGAVAAGPHDYPVPFRDAPWVAHPSARWEDPADDERAVDWVREVRSGVAPWSTGDVPLDLIGDEGAERVRAGLGVGNMLRLEKVKRAYDPDNVFRFGHNVRPL
ncbi:FAD-binding oxidoreductase [Streptomyces bauhiniae]|uniref:FAD-binding oxidoreductase n=1 Tax=Streptomyces bauhiniae TaxID=2340725 RepID=A0A7K3QT07_9ACTN|nr:FAD-binding oxidoreductase [Streptomyces bauhiniae]NEB92971.1 FAD-binding oxidoreductase [Streptomyces bauhiniae]